MKLLKILTISTLSLAALSLKAQDYPLNDKDNPTSAGVVQYIKDKASLINKRFDQEFGVNTSFTDFVPDSIDQYVDHYSDERGLYMGRNGKNQAIIDTVGSFGHYSLKTIPEKKKDSIAILYGSVRGTMIHEKAHAFFYQTKSRLEEKSIEHHYHDFNKFFFSQSFIAEGIAQYCTYKMKEMITPKQYQPSDSLKNLIAEKSSELKYEYALYYLKAFLDFFGLEEGTKILLTNPPPRKDELINPLKYYRRLEHYGALDLGFFPQMFKREDFFNIEEKNK